VYSLTQRFLEEAQLASRKQPARHRIGDARMRQIPRGEITPISSERRRLTKPLSGAGRGSGGKYFAKVASAGVVGIGRNGQATAAAIQSPEGERRGGRWASEGSGWVG
jgi:hypothetical protein